MDFKHNDDNDDNNRSLKSQQSNFLSNNWCSNVHYKEDVDEDDNNNIEHKSFSFWL